MRKGWIGVDLDGTLAHYDRWRGPHHIGEPIPAMLARVKKWLAEGREVRIFTARVEAGTITLGMDVQNGEACRNAALVEQSVRAWCKKHVGQELPVTCKKDFGMIELWDDRCVQVIPNTGRTIADELESERTALAGKAADPQS
jgi:hypothetical protein